MSDITDNAKGSLTAYSLFGYLLPGFFFVTILIFDFDASKLIRCYLLDGKLTYNLFKEDYLTTFLLGFFSSGSFSDFKVIPFFVFLIFCYLLGHIISSFSSIIIERFILKRFLGYPSDNLFRQKELYLIPFGINWIKIFKDYHHGYSIELIEQFKKSIKEILQIEEPTNRDLYWLCYSYIITVRPNLSGRVHHFVNLFGFSRNITAIFFIYALIRYFFLYLLLNVGMDKVSWFLWSLYIFISILMFNNYLKLFKRQAKDIFNIFISIYSEGNRSGRTTDTATDGL
jgi:hypothetical protein